MAGRLRLLRSATHGSAGGGRGRFSNERALDADVVRQMKKDGAATGGGTVILRSQRATSSAYSDDGVFPERAAGGPVRVRGGVVVEPIS